MSEFVIQPGECAGFNLAGYQHKNGAIQLGSTNTGRWIQEWPREITVFGMTYTLENVEKYSVRDDGAVFQNAIYC